MAAAVQGEVAGEHRQVKIVSGSNCHEVKHEVDFKVKHEVDPEGKGWSRLQGLCGGAYCQEPQSLHLGLWGTAAPLVGAQGAAATPHRLGHGALLRPEPGHAGGGRPLP